MLVNGNILCAVSPIPAFSGDFPSPTSFYEFNYLSNSYTQISVPGGGDTLSQPSYGINMIDLPDGTVLVSTWSGCFIYSPGGTMLAAGKPTVSNVLQQACTYTVTGTKFNGISEGVAYGDDWQMATNYPIVRLTSGSNVYYARSFNWNRTGVQTGALPDTTQFTVPTGLPAGTYSLQVIANGISSNPFSFNYAPCIPSTIIESGNLNNSVVVYPNPGNGIFNLNINQFENLKMAGLNIFNILGEKVYESEIHNPQSEIDLSNEPAGIYFLQLKTEHGIVSKKIIINR